MSNGKIVHYYRPHIFTTQSGSELHRLTYCAVENRGSYRSSTHADRVNCKNCLAKLIPAKKGRKGK